MAHKRAFSKTIIDTDAFQDMSQTAQLLYFYLNMNADDDGFVGNPKRIMRGGGFGDDDFKVLLAKRFLLSFENGVVVIKHWLIHNTLRKDRYTETSYLKEKNMLQIKENKAYTDHWQPTGNQLATQDKIKEDKIKEDNIATNVASVSLKEKEITDKPPFNAAEYIEKLKRDPNLRIQLIGKYMKTRGMDKSLPTKKAAETEMRRHLRVATELVEYPIERIRKATLSAMKITKEWTLETVLKQINKI